MIAEKDIDMRLFYVAVGVVCAVLVSWVVWKSNKQVALDVELQNDYAVTSAFESTAMGQSSIAAFNDCKRNDSFFGFARTLSDVECLTLVTDAAKAAKGADYAQELGKRLSTWLASHRKIRAEKDKV